MEGYQVKEIGFGVIGLGTIAKTHMDAIAITDGARLVAVASHTEDKARKVGEEKGIAWYSDHRELLKNPDVDVVCVCTPSGVRGQIIIDAARAGKHIVAEKPLEVTLEKVDAVLKECELAGVKLMSVFQNRFFGPLKDLKKAVDEGRLGRLTIGDAYVKWFRPQSYYESAAWRGTWELDGGGALMNQGIHYVDLLQWIMGPVESVFAYTDTLVREKIEVEDTLVACLRFKNGAMGTIEACTSSYPGRPASLEIHGEKGTIVVADGVVSMWKIKGEGDYVPHDTAAAGGAADPSAISCTAHQRQIDDMVRAINENRPPIVDGREGRKSIEIITAIYKSAQTGEMVRLPLG